jgi:hypothetical protein
MIRSVKGETNCVVASYKAATSCAVGDILVQEAGIAVPADKCTTTDLSTLAICQEYVHDNLLGAAQEKRTAAQTAAGNGMVATTGVVKMATAASLTAAPGIFIGLSGDVVSGIYTPTQTVVSVATANLAIGRLVKAASSAAEVEVELVSTVALGGPQTMA